MLSKSGVPHSFSLDVLLLLKAEMTVLVALFPPNGSTVSVLWKRGAGLFAVVSLASFSSLNKCQILYTHPPPTPRNLFQERGSHLYPESFRRGCCFSSTSSVAWSTASEVLCEDCLKPVLPPIPCTRYTHLSITVVLTVWPPNCKSSVLEVTSYSQFKDQ